MVEEKRERGGYGYGGRVVDVEAEAAAAAVANVAAEVKAEVAARKMAVVVKGAREATAAAAVQAAAEAEAEVTARKMTEEAKSEEAAAREGVWRGGGEGGGGSGGSGGKRPLMGRGGAGRHQPPRCGGRESGRAGGECSSKRWRRRLSPGRVSWGLFSIQALLFYRPNFEKYDLPFLKELRYKETIE